MLFDRNQNGCMLTHTVHAQSLDRTAWAVWQHIPNISS